jgi:hypothetical protein
MVKKFVGLKKLGNQPHPFMNVSLRVKLARGRRLNVRKDEENYAERAGSGLPQKDQIDDTSRWTPPQVHAARRGRSPPSRRIRLLIRPPVAFSRLG